MIYAFSKLLERSKHLRQLQTDRGSEFTNHAFQSWLKKQKIHFFHSHNHDVKCGIVERVIRTSKERLWRYFIYTNTRQYIDIIQDLVHLYNHTKHLSIKCMPAQVSFKNQGQIWQTLYGDEKVKQPKLKEDTLVRLSTVHTTFRKGYLPGWTEELFTVAQAIAGNIHIIKSKI